MQRIFEGFEEKSGQAIFEGNIEGPSWNIINLGLLKRLHAKSDQGTTREGKTSGAVPFNEKKNFQGKNQSPVFSRTIISPEFCVCGRGKTESLESSRTRPSEQGHERLRSTKKGKLFKSRTRSLGGQAGKAAQEIRSMEFPIFSHEHTLNLTCSKIFRPTVAFRNRPDFRNKWNEQIRHYKFSISPFKVSVSQEQIVNCPIRISQSKLNNKNNNRLVKRQCVQKLMQTQKVAHWKNPRKILRII